jgi:hypothetical protein
MHGPEAPNSLLLGKVAELVNCKLFNLVCLGELGHREKLDQLMTFQNIVLLNLAPLGGLFKLNERHGVIRSIHLERER